MSEIVSQLPPLTENFPPPIRVRISSGVSLGPFANGVQLRREERAFDLLSCDPARVQDPPGSSDQRGEVQLLPQSMSESKVVTALLPSSETEALTLRASYTGELPGSRCRSPRRSLGVLVPEQNKQRKKKACLVLVVALTSACEERLDACVQSVCKASRALLNSKVLE